MSAHSEAASLPVADEPTVIMPTVELETAHREADVADEPEKSPCIEIALETPPCDPVSPPTDKPEPVAEVAEPIVESPADVPPAVEATEPATTEVAQPEPVAIEPVAIEPVAIEPVATEAVQSEPVATEPVATEGCQART